jgi:O-antigen/teichoic acid export membrane protein
MIARDGDLPTGAILCFAAASLCAGSGAIALAMLNARLRFRESSGAIAIGRWVTAAVSLAGLPAVALIRGPVAFAAAVLAGEAATMGASWVAAAIRVTRAGGSDEREAETGAPGAAVGKGAAGLNLRRALPYAANGILAVLYNRFDVVILAGLSSVSQLAFYAPASRIQDALYLLPNALGTVAFPLVAAERLGARGSGRLMTRFSLLGLALAIPATAACFVLMPAIIRVVLGPGYAGAVTPTRILIWFLPISAVSSPMLAALAGSNRASDTTRIFAVTAGVALAMHLALDHWLGAVGGAIASLSREPATLGIAWMLARRAGLFGRPTGLAPEEVYRS